MNTQTLPLLSALVLSLFAGGAFAGCTAGNPSACGSAQAPGGGNNPPDNRQPADFEKACIDDLAASGGTAFAAKLAGDKALNATARNNAVVTAAKVKAYSGCVSACKKYGQDRYDWYLNNNDGGAVPLSGSPGYAEFVKWYGKPEPKLPGQSEFNACYGPAKAAKWCPGAAQSGPVADIGNGPTRLMNYLDNLEVCVQDAAGFTLLNFTAEERAWKNCAKPQVVDALARYTQERQCLDAEAVLQKVKKTGLGGLGPLIQQKP